MYHSLYIRSIIKLWEKSKKWRESMFLSIYRVYNKEYMRVNKERVRKWRERISAGKSVLFFVYRYSI